MKYLLILDYVPVEPTDPEVMKDFEGQLYKVCEPVIRQCLENIKQTEAILQCPITVDRLTCDVITGGAMLDNASAVYLGRDLDDREIHLAHGNVFTADRKPHDPSPIHL